MICLITGMLLYLPKCSEKDSPTNVYFGLSFHGITYYIEHILTLEIPYFRHLYLQF